MLLAYLTVSDRESGVQDSDFFYMVMENEMTSDLYD